MSILIEVNKLVKEQSISKHALYGNKIKYNWKKRL